MTDAHDQATNDGPAPGLSARLVAVAIALACCFWTLGLEDVNNVNEGQRLLPAAEMLENGDWIVPRIDGAVYINKPPLIYWILASAYRVAGEPSVVAGRTAVAGISLATILALLRMGERTGGRFAGAIAATVLATGVYHQHKIQQAEIDPVFAGAILGGVRFLHLACLAAGESGRSRAGRAAVSGAFWGLAFLLKGPVIVPFLLAAFAAARLAHRVPARPLAAIAATVLATATAVAAPWCVALLARLGWDEIWRKLYTESIERVAVASRINSGSIVFYLIRVFPAFLPWTLALGFVVRADCRRALLARDPFVGFGAAFAGVSFVLFSLIRGKETEYLMPIFPFVALGSALALDWALDRGGERARRGARIVAAVVCLGAVASPGLLLSEYGPFLRERAAASLCLWLVALAASAGCIAFLRTREDRSREAILAAAVAFAATLLAAQDARDLRNSAKDSPRPAAERARELADEGREALRYRVEQAHEIWYFREVSRPIEDRAAFRDELAADPRPRAVLLRRNRLESFDESFGPHPGGHARRDEIFGKYAVVSLDPAPEGTP